jgi:hypothetical protein
LIIDAEYHAGVERQFRAEWMTVVLS